MKRGKITVTTPFAVGFRPGDQISFGDGVRCTVASVKGTVITLNPNIFQRAAIWLRRTADALNSWMFKWDCKFAERYDDRREP